MDILSALPQEVARLDTAHLQDPFATPSWSALFGQRLAHFSDGIPSLSLASMPGKQLLQVTIATGVITSLGWWSLQPITPALGAQQKQELTAYIQEQNTGTAALAQALPAATPEPEQNQTNTQLVSADSSNTIDTTAQLTASPKDTSAYNYHMTLSQGFLNKAVTLSQQSANRAQTEQEKQNILQYLEEALAAANKAIELAPNNGLGFFLRSRIYATSSVLRPELTELSKQDAEIAKALGVDTTLSQNTSILDLLPTEQATNIAGGPIIADPESGTSETVQTALADNAVTSTALLPSGQTSVYVSYPQLAANMSLSVKISADSPTKTTGSFFVQSREEGKGFTIATSGAFSSDVLLEWQAVIQ